MAEHSSSDSVTSDSAKSHGFLQDLIERLHHLMIVISSKLRHAQIHHSPMGDAKGDYDIWERLGNHLQQVPVREKPDAKPRAIPKEASIEGYQSGSLASYTMPAAPPSNELRKHNKRKAAHQKQPRISEQLKSKTMEHINIALILAAEGNQEGVRLHIDLANSAMHTASRFLSHEDYEAFEEKVESRLRSIIDGDRHDDPGQK
jgi:hypothetical protein